MLLGAAFINQMKCRNECRTAVVMLPVLVFCVFVQQVCAEEACCYDSVVFEGPPVTQQVLWPVHCVQGMWGAQLHPLLKVTTTITIEGILFFSLL